MAPGKNSTVGLVSGAVLAALCILLVGAGGSSYVVGSSRCKDCHEKEYNAWKGSAHSRSTVQLSEKERGQVKCQVCHTTGEGRVQEVGCEACHGGGRYYAFMNVMRDRELSKLLGLETPGEGSCSSCHSGNSPKMRQFDIKKSMEAIKHWPDKR
jgi:RecJ-like exonuclease